MQGTNPQETRLCELNDLRILPKLCKISLLKKTTSLDLLYHPVKSTWGIFEKCCVTVAQVRKNEQDNWRRSNWDGWQELPGFPWGAAPGVTLCPQAELGTLAFRPQLREIKQELNKIPRIFLPHGRKAPKSKQQTQLLHVPPKPSPVPPTPYLLLPLLMPGDSPSQEGIYFCIIG